MLKLKTNFKKRTLLIYTYKDIELGTRVRIFCTALFTNNNIKLVIQMHAFLFDHEALIKGPLKSFNSLFSNTYSPFKS